MRRPLLLVATSCAVAVLAACGTTVRPGSGTTVTSAASAGLDAPAGATAAADLPSTPSSTSTSSSTSTEPVPVGEGPAVTAAGAGPSVAGTVPGRRTVAPSPARGSGGASAGPTRRAASTAPPGPVQVGFEIEGSDTAVAGSLGISGVDNGDERATMDALVADLNDHGGLAGHPVQAVYYTIDATTTQTYDQLDQAACSTFTEDHHVVVILSLYHQSSSHTLARCAGAKGIPVVDPTAYSVYSSGDLTPLPLLVAEATVSIQTVETAEVQSLVAAGFLTRTSRIGLVRYDDTAYADGEAALRSALKAAGLTLTDVATATSPNQTSDAGVVSSQAASAELKFATERIDRVLFLESGAFLALEFMNAADKQGYHPTYALTTDDGPSALVGLVPASQLTGARGIGWSPDTDLVDFSGTPSPGTAACLAALHAHGVDPASGTPQSVAFEACDQLGVVAAAARQGGGISAAQLLQGLRGLGTSYRSAQLFGTSFGAGDRFGAGSYRPTAFDSATSSMAYTGPATTFSTS